MNSDIKRKRVHFLGKAKSRRENKMKKMGEEDTDFVPWQILEACNTLRISQICSQNSATGFDHRVQNVLRVQKTVSWVSNFVVVAHFRS